MRFPWPLPQDTDEPDPGDGLNIAANVISIRTETVRDWTATSSLPALPAAHAFTNESNINYVTFWNTNKTACETGIKTRFGFSPSQAVALNFTCSVGKDCASLCQAASNNCPYLNAPQGAYGACIKVDVLNGYLSGSPILSTKIVEIIVPAVDRSENVTSIPAPAVIYSPAGRDFDPTPDSFLDNRYLIVPPFTEAVAVAEITHKNSDLMICNSIAYYRYRIVGACSLNRNSTGAITSAKATLFVDFTQETVALPGSRGPTLSVLPGPGVPTTTGKFPYYIGTSALQNRFELRPLTELRYDTCCLLHKKVYVAGYRNVATQFCSDDVNSRIPIYATPDSSGRPRWTFMVQGNGFYGERTFSMGCKNTSETDYSVASFMIVHEAPEVANPSLLVTQNDIEQPKNATVVETTYENVAPGLMLRFSIENSLQCRLYDLTTGTTGTVRAFKAQNADVDRLLNSTTFVRLRLAISSWWPRPMLVCKMYRDKI